MTLSIDRTHLAHPNATKTVANKSLFDQFDKNKDGVLDAKEFNAFAKSVGIDGDELFKEIETKTPGKITFAEFNKALPKIKSDVFDNLDLDDDGFLDESEIAEFSKQYHFDPKKVMGVLDRDKDGLVSSDEFVKNFGKIMANPQMYSTLGAKKTGHHSPHSGTTTQDEMKAKAMEFLRQQQQTPGSSMIDFLNSSTFNTFG